jgi:hypothetical protein
VFGGLMIPGLARPSSSTPRTRSTACCAEHRTSTRRRMWVISATTAVQPADTRGPRSMSSRETSSSLV